MTGPYPPQQPYQGQQQPYQGQAQPQYQPQQGQQYHGQPNPGPYQGQQSPGSQSSGHYQGHQYQGQTYGQPQYGQQEYPHQQSPYPASYPAQPGQAQPGQAQPGQAQPPGAAPQPGYPPPGGGGGDGMGAISITTKFMWLAFTFALFKPKVFVNGQQVANSWGQAVIPVPAGQHQVHVHIPYLVPSRLGPADAAVPVQPGQTVELEYRAPVWAFSAGALGPPPQKYNGMAAQFIILGIVIALLCVCCVGSLVANA